MSFARYREVMVARTSNLHRRHALVMVLIGFSLVWIWQRLGDEPLSSPVRTRHVDKPYSSSATQPGILDASSSVTTLSPTPMPNLMSLFKSKPPSVTLVLGYFDLKKKGHTVKHSSVMYNEIGKNVLSIRSPMVIFTDDPLLEGARRQLVPEEVAGTWVVHQPLENLTTWQNHYNRISQVLHLDPEARMFKYSAALFTLYHAKTELVAKAIEINPFGSKKYMWVDLGSLRDWGGIQANDYRIWPKPSLVHRLSDQGRVILQGVGGAFIPCKSAKIINPQEPYEPSTISKNVYNDVLDVPGPQTPGNWFIAGSLFGGDVDSLVKFHQVYSEALTRYLHRESDRYDLIDQHLLGAIACTRSDLVSIVRPPPKCCIDRVNRKWFFLYMYLGHETFPTQPYTREEMVVRGMVPPFENGGVH